MSVNSKMTALADEIRELSGTTTSKSIDAMTTDVSAANTEISEQSDIISQIKSVVNGLPEAGAGAPNLQSKTVSPITSSQTVKPDSGYDGLSEVVVKAIPSTYVKPSLIVPATTYTPSTSNQIISAGTYCSGTHTIIGDSNLVAENIKSGVSIFGVNGTYEGSGSGGGGNVETCSVTLINTNEYDDCIVCGMWFDDGYVNSCPTDVYCDDSKVKIAIKNSYITVITSELSSISGSCLNMGILGSVSMIHVTGDCTITFE